MNISKLTKVALLTSALVAGTASIASASGYSNCEVVYGGGSVCPPNVSFTLDKLVQSPTKGGQLVDNLTINDATFTPGQNVTFQIKVKNTGESKIDHITITDTLPAELSYVGGGKFDESKKTITFEVNNLDKDKEAAYFLTTKVSDKNVSNTVSCITNRVTAADNAGNKAEDTANVCVNKPGATVQPSVPTKNIPNTGPEEILYVILPTLGAAGLYLRRKAGL